jgi:hypothetical protein
MIYNLLTGALIFFAGTLFGVFVTIQVTQKVVKFLITNFDKTKIRVPPSI